MFNFDVSNFENTIKITDFSWPLLCKIAIRRKVFICMGAEGKQTFKYPENHWPGVMGS